MSAFDTMLSPGPAPDTTGVGPQPLAPNLRTRLPNIWIGYGISFVVLMLLLLGLQQNADASQRLDLTAIGLVLFFVGWIYWLFFVHRLHRVLKEASEGTYRVTPRRAVGFQFIPLYSLIWCFVWPKRIAEFVNERNPAHRMSKVLPGILLLLGALMGEAVAPAHLFLLFLAGHYILRRVRQVLPPFEATVVGRRRDHQLSLAMSAGVGAVFAFKLFQAFWNPLNQDPPKEILHDILAITIVSLGVILFLEPLAEVSRSRLGIEEHHVHAMGTSWRLKLGVFGILALTSLAHGFLHKQIDSEMTSDPMGTLAGIVGATLVSGCITYAWVSGASRKTPRAAWFGVATGAVVALSVALLIVSGSQTQNDGATSMVENATANVGGRGVEVNSPVPLKVLINLEKNLKNDKLREEWNFDLRKILLPWTVLGLIGGFVIDRKWARPGRCAALTIVGAAMVLFPLFAFLATRYSMQSLRIPTAGEVIGHIVAVGGWASSLSIFPFADALLAGHHAAVTTQLHAEANEQPAA